MNLQKAYNEIFRGYVKEDLKAKLLEKKMCSYNVIFDAYTDILHDWLLRKMHTQKKIQVQ